MCISLGDLVKTWVLITKLGWSPKLLSDHIQGISVLLVCSPHGVARTKLWVSPKTNSLCTAKSHAPTGFNVTQ